MAHNQKTWRMEAVTKVEAYKGGWHGTVNPFEKGSDAWLAWNNGHYDAMKKAADKELDEYYQKILAESLN